MINNRHINNVLVTGGAGFIGSHLVETLLKTGVDKITVLDNFSEGSLTNLGVMIEKVKTLKIDITLEDWRDILAESNYEFIFHFAGNANVQTSVQKPDVDYYLNLQPTFKLLEAIRHSKWRGCLIFSSSAAVYGNPLALPIREVDPTDPISPYGVGKLAAERYLSIYSKLYGIKTASMRSASVYGPRLKKQVVYDTFQKITRNHYQLTILGDGSQSRDFIFVKDVAQAAIDIAMHGELAGEAYNVASGRSYSTFELAKVIANELNVDPEFCFTGNVRPGEPDNWEFDIQRLTGIGFCPSYSLQDGISQTREWFMTQ